MSTSSKGLNAIVAMQGSRNLPSPRKAMVAAGATPGDPGIAGVGFWQIVEPLSIGLSAYHGYKRNNGSLGWGIGWGILGGLFPIITPAIAIAEGFAKPAK